ncbi:MAG: MotA/TolQ/ExbB proton channel family protein [Bacteroidales bacterium]|jgi:biopolymer transport protein ExbB/TolQ|nr:MotA/TolQ/ExbB proton channel family protein [Bacteroidales bacterium]
MFVFEKLLYWLSSGLLAPVMVAVVFFLVRGLVLIGKLYGVYAERLKYIRRLDEEINRLTPETIDGLAALPASKTLLAQAVRRLWEHRGEKIFGTKIVADFEVECEKDLDRSRTLSKTGPMLGLMGTLIPLGPALAGLADGDIAVMSRQMQIAFNTTVVGLAIGAMGYLTLQTKQRWYAADLNRLDFINDMINK